MDAGKLEISEEFSARIIAAIEAQGFLPPEEIDPAADPQRFAISPDDKKCSGFLFINREGDATFGIWNQQDADGTPITFQVRGETVRSVDPEARKKLFEAREAKRKKEARITGDNAARIFEQGVRNAPRPCEYEKLKGVRLPGAVVNVGWYHKDKSQALMVPIRYADKSLASLEFIKMDGTLKERLPGKVQPGAFYRAGNPDPKNPVVYITEGAADAATVWHCVGLCAVACMGLPNLRNVIIALQDHAPNFEFILCADNDEAGLKVARKASADFGLRLAVPPGDGRDINDLFREEGEEAVRECLSAAKVYERAASEVIQDKSPEKLIPNPREALLSLCVDDAAMKKLEEEIANYRVIVPPFFGQGEFGIISAPAAAGKTFLMMAWLQQAAEIGALEGFEVIYLNFDDSRVSAGIKRKHLDKYGIKTIVPGLMGADTTDIIPLIESITRKAEAENLVLVVDTLTRIVNPMNKDQCRALSNLLYNFTQAGGTVLALGHTNKNLDSNGELLPEGCADLYSNCTSHFMAYVLQHASKGGDEQIVQIKKKKLKGLGQRTHGIFKFKTPPDCATASSYGDALATLEEVVDPQEVEAVTDDAQFRATLDKDAEIIAAVCSLLSEHGEMNKESLRDAVQQQGFPRAKADEAIDRYAGNEPSERVFWRVERGVKKERKFSLFNNDKEVS